MTPERWERLQSLFSRALDLPEAERAAFVAGLSGEDEDVKDELGRMLDVHDPDSSWPLPDESLVAGDPLLGTTLGDYRLDAVLGRGGSGVVYRAQQISKGRTVAVKVLRAGIAPDSAAYERFKREALSASRLRHPNLVHVLYLGRDEGLDYLVMERIDGPNLHDQMVYCQALDVGAVPEEGPDLRDPRVCAALVRDLARALEYAHSERVLHRDVKPRNVMLAKDGVPLLTDFGLAKDLELIDLTRTGEVAGTPRYMSPEQARAVRNQIDHRTDIYSLGAVLYELLSGRTPAAGDTTAEVIHNILHKPIIPLRRRNHAIDTPLALVCMQALRRRLERRYQTAGEMADDLDRYLGGQAVGAKAQSLAERASERLVDRRLLMRLVPAAAAVGLLGGWGLYAGTEAAHARSLRPRVEVVVADGRDARVSFLPMDDWCLPRGAEIDLGRTRGGSLDASIVPAGEGRIVVRTIDGGYSEHTRSLEPGATVRVTSHPTLRRGDEVGMARFSGAQVDPGFRPESVDTSSAISRERTVMLPDFVIDVACVTNAEYRTFLEESGSSWPEHWSSTWIAIWEDPPRADWGELPVVGVTAEEALAFAEWTGKRLPTALELEYARGAHSEPSLIGELELGALAAAFNIEQPAAARWGDQELKTTGGAYILHAQPARSGGELAGTPLFHAIGNVSEWTETRVLMPLGAVTGIFRQIKGDSWSSELTLYDARMTLFSDGLFPEDGSSQDLGFRCARSLTD